MTLKFFYNGIKGGDKKLQKCRYSIGPYRTLPENVITIYAKDYTGFSEEIRAIFDVKNDSDFQSDYHETDRIHVYPDHNLYNDVFIAYQKQEAR